MSRKIREPDAAGEGNGRAQEGAPVEIVTINVPEPGPGDTMAADAWLCR